MTAMTPGHSDLPGLVVRIACTLPNHKSQSVRADALLEGQHV